MNIVTVLKQIFNEKYVKTPNNKKKIVHTPAVRLSNLFLDLANKFGFVDPSTNGKIDIPNEWQFKERTIYNLNNMYTGDVNKRMFSRELSGELIVFEFEDYDRLDIDKYEARDVDWENNQRKYYLDDNLNIRHSYTVKKEGAIYFPNKEAVVSAIDLLGNEYTDKYLKLRKDGA